MILYMTSSTPERIPPFSVLGCDKIDCHTEPNLRALKEGFKANLRDFIGLDGTFMKGPYPGQVLTVVGVDSNNGIYPLAYAFDENETIDSWTWFLEQLGDDLELYANSNFTFISDRQKVHILQFNLILMLFSQLTIEICN